MSWGHTNQMDQMLLDVLAKHDWNQSVFLTIAIPNATYDTTRARMLVLRKAGWICTIIAEGKNPDGGFATLLVSKFEPDPLETPRPRATRMRR